MQPSKSSKEEVTVLLLLDTDEIGNLKRMPYAIRSIQMDGNEIQIKISYAGGCKSHDFGLAVDRNLISNLNKNINLILSHNDNGDRCKRIVNEKLVFDLSPLVKLIDVKDLNRDLKLTLDNRPVEKFKEVSN